MDKRYQVFVSSTYADLKEERQRVIQTVMEMDCIPAGMELFPAADEEQFEFIKRVIDDCDYYLLIIGGRYGSTTTDGISYTEKEYEYAISKGLKVIALVHEEPDSIAYGKSEQDPKRRNRLQKFREKVSSNRLVKFWKSADQLPSLVALSLASTIKTFPAIGWVRGNRAANEDVLGEINELRKENDHLQKVVTELTGTMPNGISDLAGLDDTMKFQGIYHESGYQRPRQWFARVSWGKIFGDIAPYLIKHPSDDYVKSTLTKALFEQSTASENGYSPDCDDQEFRTVAIQLQALGLVNVKYTQSLAGGMGLFWSLTPRGERMMMELRTVRKSTNAAKPE